MNRVAVKKPASRGSISQYTIGAPPMWGQPRAQIGDAEGYITSARMRERVLKTPTAAACTNVVVDFSAGVKILVRNVDASKPGSDAKTKILMDFLDNPNPQETGKDFKKKLLRDLTTIGYAAIEIERNSEGKVANLFALDAGRMHIDYDEHGTVKGYTMMNAYGIPITSGDGVHAWVPEDIIYIQRDPVTDSLYPIARIAQIFPSAVLEALMLEFIGARFTDSNIPYCVLDLGDITPDELTDAVSLWNEQMQQLGQSKMMLTASKSGLKFVSFHGQLKDLDAKSLLLQVRSQIMSVIGVTVNELGEAADVNKSNGFNLSYTFKKRAVEPSLDCIVVALTERLIRDEFGFTDCEYYYAEIDSRDELLEAQIDDLRLKGGTVSINEVRNKRGETSVEGGDEPNLVIGITALPVSLIGKFAKAQLKAMELEAKTLQAALDAGTPPTAPVAKLSSPKGPQVPEKSSLPNGDGNMNMKLKLPEAKPPSGSQGPVNNGKAIGNR